MPVYTAPSTTICTHMHVPMLEGIRLMGRAVHTHAHTCMSPCWKGSGRWGGQCTHMHTHACPHVGRDQADGAGSAAAAALGTVAAVEVGQQHRGLQDVARRGVPGDAVELAVDEILARGEDGALRV